MDAIFTLILILSSLVTLGAAAVRFGVDTRDTSNHR
jgi:hypothetical protein